MPRPNRLSRSLPCRRVDGAGLFWPSPRRGSLSRILVGLLTVWAGGLSAQEDDPPRGTVIRILAPPGQQLSGRTPIETLAIETEIARVVFYLDGQEVAVRKIPPFNAKVKLAHPPREQTVRVVAYGRGGQLGDDEVVVNRKNPPLRVQITDLEGDPASGSVTVRADVTLPRNGVLARMELYLNEELRKINRELPFAAALEIPDPGPADFVRVVAVLEDGRAVEDVEVLAAPGLTEEVDVDLVQLQALVSYKNGAPVTDLTRDDFEVRERGQVRPVDRLYLAGDVTLNLGLVLDSSGSMAQRWPATTAAAEQFLNETLADRDRSFLVDFDTQLRLVQPLTGEVEHLVAAIAEIEPTGGTALYDSILYSLLQFTDQPGRRALVVLTDGYDVESKSNPKRSVDFAQLLGVPVYVIALSDPGQRPAGGSYLRATPVQDLKLLTEPTGGRLIRIRSAGAMARAFAHINTELRHQYILTYYSEQPPSADEHGAVRITVPGRKDVEVRTVWAQDQVN